MRIEWNKVTWYSKLAAVILFFLVLLLGIYIGSEYQKLNQVAPVSVSKIHACPDEWIENKMPAVNQSGSSPREYFIFAGQRKELSDYNVEWIRLNCKVSAPSPVY